jgi:hypothetical protein
MVEPSSRSSSIRLLFSVGLFWMSFLRFQSQWHAAVNHRHYDAMRRSLMVDTAEDDTTNRNNNNTNNANKQGGGRLLYIVTSMRMYDSGRRETTKGNDRFGQSLIPIIAETAKSLLNNRESSDNLIINHVDVYLVAFFNVNEARRMELRRALPNQVGLEIWQDAAPLMYDYQNGKLLNVQQQKDGTKKWLPIRNHTRGLARQHRYVLKDKLLHYDYFVCLEDDMILHGTQMQNYIRITNHLYHLRTTAATNATTRQQGSSPAAVAAVAGDPASHHADFYGPMTAKMLQRTIPGWFRVEAGRYTVLPALRVLSSSPPLSHSFSSAYRCPPSILHSHFSLFA